MDGVKILETSVPLSSSASIAVIGAGAFGRFCIDAYQRTSDLHVVAVADTARAALDQVTSRKVRRELDWRRVVEAEDIEVVHVATPPYLRSDIVFAALKAGKAVFCEKPLALSLAEADAMIEAAAHSQSALGVNYVMRYQPAYRILEKIADSGALGRLRTVSFQNFAQSLSKSHWFWDRTKSGGIFVEHGVHFFDAYGRIAGRPRAVTGSVPRAEAVEATLSYDRDVVGRFYHEFSFPIQVERTIGTSFFEGGYVEIEGWIPARLRGAGLDFDTEALTREFGSFGLVADRVDGVSTFLAEFPDRDASYRNAVIAGIRDLVRKFRDPDHAMVVTVEDARESLRVGLLCQDAALSGTPTQPLR